MDLGALCDFGVFKGRELRILGGSVLVLVKEVGDIVVHCEEKGLFGVIPVDIDSGESGAGPVFYDVVVFLEDVT